MRPIIFQIAIFQITIYQNGVRVSFNLIFSDNFVINKVNNSDISTFPFSNGVNFKKWSQNHSLHDSRYSLWSLNNPQNIATGKTSPAITSFLAILTSLTFITWKLLSFDNFFHLITFIYHICFWRSFKIPDNRLRATNTRVWNGKLVYQLTISPQKSKLSRAVAHYPWQFLNITHNIWWT